MSKKRKSNDEMSFEMAFETSTPKKSRKSEDVVMSDSVSGISRSGRIRKKSAKLMEMEDLDGPEADSEMDSKNRKKQLKVAAAAAAATAILPTEEFEPDGSRKVAPIKIWSRPPGSSKQGSESTVSTPAVLTAVPASGYITDHPNLSLTPGRNVENKVNKKPKIKTEQSPSKVMSPLKVNVGEFSKLGPGDDNDTKDDSSLRLKLILSPKDKGSSGETDFSGSEPSPNKIVMEPEKKKKKKLPKQLGSANRSPLDLLASGGITESSEMKSKVKTKKPVIKDRPKQIIISPMADDSPEVDIGDSELGDSSELIIAEPAPKVMKKKKPSSKKPPEIKTKPKMLGESTMLGDYDESSDGDDIDSNDTAISINSTNHSRSVCLAEKKKGKKKKIDKLSSSSSSKNDKKKGRPITAYMLWCREHRRRIVADNPDMDFATISRRLGEAWQSLHDKEKLNWRRKAKRLSAKGSNLINTSKNSDQSRNKLIVKQQKTQSTDSDGSTNLKDLYKVVGTAPLDVAAHLKLLGESLSIIGQRLTEHEGQIAVSGSLSVLLDSTLCALGPLLCLTAEVPEMNGCSEEKLAFILDNVAYIMPGL